MILLGDQEDRQRKTKDHELYIDSLRLAKDVSEDIADIVINNRSLIDSAYEHVDVILRRDEQEIAKLSGTNKESDDGKATTEEQDPERVF